jgi:DNA segregation ATPase FtsK/SpoIIIE, S-DNA-T family
VPHAASTSVNDPSPRPLAERVRRVLADLTPLVADRAAREAALAQRLKEQTASLEREHKQALAARETATSTAKQAIEAEKLAKMDLIRTRHEKDFGDAHAVMTADLAAFTDTTARLEARAEQKLEDSRWLAETLVESGEQKARAEYETAAKDHKIRREEVEAVRAKAAGLLTTGGYPPLGITPAAGEPDVSRSLPQHVEACRTAGATLESRVKPALLRPSSLMIAGLLSAMIGAGVGFALAQGAGASGGVGGKVALGAGVGLASAMTILLLLRLLLRRRVPAAAGNLARILGEADAALDLFLARAEETKAKILADAAERRDKELAKGQGRYTSARQEIDRRKLDEEPELRGKHRQVMDRVLRRTGEKSAEVEAEAARKVDALLREHHAGLASATASRDQRLADATREHAEGIRTLHADWATGLARAKAELAALTDATASLSRPWEGPEAPPWDSFDPPRTPPVASRFGTLGVRMDQMPGSVPKDDALRDPAAEAFDLPALLDFYGTGSLLIQAPPEQRADAVAALQAVMLRLLTTFPPGKLKFTIIDPVGLGQSFAGFMHLADHDESLVSDKIWTDARHIEQKLTDLTEHMEAVIQKYLRNEFATIQAYNERAGEVAEPFRFLVVADFPANFTEAAAKKLASIVASGPRCGVYTLIATDTRQRPPAWVPLPEMERASANVVGKDGKLLWKDPDFAAWPLTLERPPSEDVVTRIAHAVGSHAKEMSRVQVPFATVAPAADELWTRSASSDLRVPLGKAGATKVQHLTLGRGTSQHVLIAGRTGSGKSTLLHALITASMLWYSPWELELYLVDFKKGVEFNTYATHQVPHARVIAVESEREFGLSVLRRLDAELTRRGNLFRELGVQDLAGYRKAKGEAEGSANPSVPRTLLIVDEFQEFFTEDDKIAQEAMLLMDRLVRQGRAFGMHVVLGSQTIGGAYSLARATIGQMAVRIALQCSEADSYLILSEDNAAARLLSRPGEAIYNDQSGMIEGNSPFQVVWLPDEVRDGHLDAVEARAKASRWDADPSHTPAIVFQGNVPSHLPRNHLLAAVLEGRSTPAMPTVWLGEAISIKDPTAVKFRRQSGSNLLIVGQQELPTLGLIVASIVSLAPQAARTARLPALTILDGGTSDAESTPELADVVKTLGPGVAGLAGTAGAGRAADAALAALYEEFQRRQTSDAAEHTPLFLVVWGLQRFRSLRKADSDFGFDASDEPAAKPDKQFAALLKDGPSVGIFTIVRVDTSTNLERAMDRRMLKEFDHRVLFQMSANDSSNLIDSTAAGNLGQHRGLLYSEETGQIEKFRPYAVPERDWLARTLGTLPSPVV